MDQPTNATLGGELIYRKLVTGQIQAYRSGSFKYGYGATKREARWNLEGDNTIPPTNDGTFDGEFFHSRDMPDDWTE